VENVLADGGLDRGKAWRPTSATIDALSGARSSMGKNISLLLAVLDCDPADTRPSKPLARTSWSSRGIFSVIPLLRSIVE